MPQRVVMGSQQRTVTALNASKNYLPADMLGSYQAFAGPNSRGLVSGGVSASASIQFGTGAADATPNTAFTCTPTEQISGSAPKVIQTLPNGDQTNGYGRVVWRASDKSLRLLQKADDALISNCPRNQVFHHAMLNITGYYRYILHIRFGDAQTPWPAFVTNKNSILFFQLKGDAAAFPPLDAQLRDASNGDTTMRNIVFLRRLDNTNTGGQIGDGSGQDYVLIIPNVRPADLHRFAIDFRPDWRSPSNGGAAYLAVHYQGTQQLLHAHVGGGLAVTDQTVYPITANATGNDLYQAMVGIYRTSYQSAKAPDDCAVVIEKEEMQVFGSVPEWPVLSDY